MRSKNKKTMMGSMLLMGAACLVCVPHARAASSQALVVFGDSYSDTGRVWRALEEETGQNLPVSPPYFQGRFSNGPVAVEYMAASLGIPLDSRAWGGALASEGNILGAQAGLADTGLPAQVRAYLAERGGQPLDADTLHVVWIGANDLIFKPNDATAQQASSHIVSAIDALYAAGARSFFVPGMPDLSLSPLLASPSSPAGHRHHQASLSFNAKLAEGLKAIGMRLPDARIVQFDTMGFLDEWLQGPQAQGLNLEQACVEGSFVEVEAVCSDPGMHVYWDGTHFSTQVHAALGVAFAAAAVPEPSSLSLTACGLASLSGLLGGIRRIQRGRRWGSWKLDADAGATAR